jgi:hypothetical protein
MNGICDTLMVIAGPWTYYNLSYSLLCVIPDQSFTTTLIRDYNGNHLFTTTLMFSGGRFLEQMRVDSSVGEE